MRTCIYFSSPAFGNINPSLSIVKELVSRGDKVIYYAIDHFKEMIESTGAQYRSYGSNYPQNVYFTQKKQSDYSFQEFLFGLSINMLGTYRLVKDDLLEELEQINVDYIIHDSYSYLGKRIGMMLGKTCICLMPNYAIPKNSLLCSSEKVLKYVFLNKVSSIEKLNNWIHKCEKIIEKRFDEECIELMDFTLCEEKCNLICSIPNLNMFCSDFDSTYHFIGSMVNISEQIQQEKSVIYISLGTVLNDEYEFYLQCIQALSELGYEICISIGHNLEVVDFGEIPSNVHLYQYAPQIEILKNSALFITHGGYNSFNEAVYFGVPMLLIPKGNEQFITAETAQKLKIGKVIQEQELTVEYLKNSVMKMLNEKMYYKNILKISSILREKSKIGDVADIIINFINSQN
ncbi:MAG: hypothetical protein K2M78_09750 [Lachnospiraceae bacterium]|nr:hypothetical protein [Lachnospiraceae bacterium]